MFPGFGYGGISKDDIYNLTYSQFRAIMKSFNEKKEKDIPQNLGADELNRMINEWREENADN